MKSLSSIPVVCLIGLDKKVFLGVFLLEVHVLEVLPCLTQQNTGRQQQSVAPEVVEGNSSAQGGFYVYI